jgi:molecular chaperone DnaK
LTDHDDSKSGATAVPPSEEPPVRVRWGRVGDRTTRVDSLRDVTPVAACLVTEAEAHTGDEVRFDVLDRDNRRLATGLARVTFTRTDPGEVGLSFLALGIDPAALVQLGASLERISSVPASTGAYASAVAGAARPQAMPETVRSRPPALPPTLPTATPPKPTAGLDDLLVVEHTSVPPAGVDLEEVGPLIEPLPIPKPGLIIGIDLGTTNTCASYIVDGKPTIIPGRTGTNTIPSMITFEPDGTWHVGQRAADRQVLFPLRTVYGSKRLVGRTYRADVAQELQQHFAYPLGEADGQRFGARIGDRVISMDTIAARVLDEVRKSAEAFLGQPVEAAVITVPAYFSEVQREAVRRAAREANLVVHRIVNEPTAAAVAYGHKQPGKTARIAVWDFGGGTFDFSVVDLRDGELEVLGTGGDNFVGGSDFDDALASWILSEFQRIIGTEIEPEPQQIARLRGAAEVAKQALSTQSETTVELPEFTREPKRTLTVEVSRETLNELIQPLIDRTVAIAKEVLEASALSPTADIDDVVLVGGTTRIPAVEAAVAELFQRRPSKRINPDEAVALGAALIGDEIATGSSPTLLDILPMTVGRGTTGLAFSPLVPRNTRLPARSVLEIDADILGSVLVPLFQGENPDVSRNEYLCTVVVEDRSLWDKGRVRLALSFDEHCVMAVEAVNARTRAPLPVKLDRTRALEDVLRELGHFEGPPEPAWKPPPSRLGGVLGKLFKMFGKK